MSTMTEKTPAKPRSPLNIRPTPLEVIPDSEEERQRYVGMGSSEYPCKKSNSYNRYRCKPISTLKAVEVIEISSDESERCGLAVKNSHWQS